MGWNRLRSKASTGQVRSLLSRTSWICTSLCTVGRLTYYPLVLDGRLGYLCLSRGFTGRYKFDHSGRGTGSFRNGVVESDGEQMLLFEGRNGDGPHRPGGLFTGGRRALCAGHSGLSRLSASVPVEDTVPTEPVSIEDITFYDSQGRRSRRIRPQRRRHPVSAPTENQAGRLPLKGSHHNGCDLRH